MKELKHLGFSSLINLINSRFKDITDNRAKNSKYNIVDVMMSGLGMMFFQEPSMLQFQRSLEEEESNNNLRTMFKVEEIPKDNQIRNILDEVDSQNFSSIFKDILYRLQRNKILNEYQFFPNQYLISLDGSQYFSSDKLCCANCIKKKHSKGKVSYSHHILQAAIMHSDQKQVLPLMPEEISNKDGSTKQDCEINAAKRLINNIHQDHPRLGIILNGDGLFSKQPIIEQILIKGMHYIFVAKEDHKNMYNYIANQSSSINKKEIIDDQNKVHSYEWLNKVPLNGNKDTIYVNYFRYQQIVIDEEGQEKVVYKNSWVTDFEIKESNILHLVKGARCIWKIENECFNSLKNQGYSIEHNYGHGVKNLSFNFLLLTLLAFYLHQFFELTDKLFQACRKKYGSKQYLWSNLKSVIRIIVFDSWRILLEFMFDKSKFEKWVLKPS